MKMDFLRKRKAILRNAVKNEKNRRTTASPVHSLTPVPLSKGRGE